MTAPYAGSCACGAVCVTIRGEPVGVRQCWCRRCQKIAAGGPSTNAIVKSADLTVSGNLASCDYSAESGNVVRHYFCPACGSSIHALSPGTPGFAAVRLGLLDPGHQLTPEGQIWVSEAPSWAVFDPALERLERQTPPRPPR